MRVVKNSAIVTRRLEQCTACINLPPSWGGRGLFVCAYTMAVERGRARLSCTTGGGVTVIGVKRERKKEICRAGRDDRRGKSRESQWAAVCAREGLKWSSAVQPFYVANIYESLYYVRVAGARAVVVRVKRGWERVFTTTTIYHTASAALSQCNSLVFPPQQPPATWLFASLHRP